MTQQNPQKSKDKGRDNFALKVRLEEAKMRIMVEAVKGVYETTEDPFKRIDEFVDGIFNDPNTKKALEPAWRTDKLDFLKTTAVSMAKGLSDLGINHNVDVSNIAEGNAAADAIYQLKATYEKWRMEKRAEARKDYADAMQKVVDLIAKGSNPKGGSP